MGEPSIVRSLTIRRRVSAPIAEIATGGACLGRASFAQRQHAAGILDRRVRAAKPGEINYASPGRGTPQHLAMELFKLMAQVKLTHIPYPGLAGAVKDLAGGHVSAMLLPIHTALPLAEVGQIRILAVGEKPERRRLRMCRRWRKPALPISTWIWRYGVLAPAGTPKAIHAIAHNAEFNTILNQPKRSGRASRQARLDRARRPTRSIGSVSSRKIVCAGPRSSRMPRSPLKIAAGQTAPAGQSIMTQRLLIAGAGIAGLCTGDRADTARFSRDDLRAGRNVVARDRCRCRSARTERGCSHPRACSMLVARSGSRGADGQDDPFVE